jgi:hypothetical protein
MLLGFPLDYRSSEYLQAAIGSFGRLILWEEDRHNVTRTLLRVRVTSLEEVPQFIVFPEADGFIGDSWTVQCEIIQQNMLGGQAQDEDPVPEAPEDGQQLPLVFLVWVNLCHLLASTSTSRQFLWEVKFWPNMMTMFRRSGANGSKIYNLNSRFNRPSNWMCNRSVTNTLVYRRTTLLVSTRARLFRMATF